MNAKKRSKANRVIRLCGYLLITGLSITTSYAENNNTQPTNSPPMSTLSPADFVSPSSQAKTPASPQINILVPSSNPVSSASEVLAPGAASTLSPADFAWSSSQGNAKSPATQTSILPPSAFVMPPAGPKPQVVISTTAKASPQPSIPPSTGFMMLPSQSKRQASKVTPTGVKTTTPEKHPASMEAVLHHALSTWRNFFSKQPPSQHAVPMMPMKQPEKQQNEPLAGTVKKDSQPQLLPSDFVMPTTASKLSPAESGKLSAVLMGAALPSSANAVPPKGGQANTTNAVPMVPPTLNTPAEVLQMPANSNQVPATNPNQGLSAANGGGSTTSVIPIATMSTDFGFPNVLPSGIEKGSGFSSYNYLLQLKSCKKGIILAAVDSVDIKGYVNDDCHVIFSLGGRKVNCYLTPSQLHYMTTDEKLRKAKAFDEGINVVVKALGSDDPTSPLSTCQQ